MEWQCNSLASTQRLETNVSVSRRNFQMSRSRLVTFGVTSSLVSTITKKQTTHNSLRSSIYNLSTIRASQIQSKHTIHSLEIIRIAIPKTKHKHKTKTVPYLTDTCKMAISKQTRNATSPYIQPHGLRFGLDSSSRSWSCEFWSSVTLSLEPWGLKYLKTPDLRAIQINYHIMTLSLRLSTHGELYFYA